MQAKASQQQGTLVARELHKQAYQDALVQRYQHMPEIRRITRHRHLPVPLYKVLQSVLSYCWSFAGKQIKLFKLCLNI